MLVMAMVLIIPLMLFNLTPVGACKGMSTEMVQTTNHLEQPVVWPKHAPHPTGGECGLLLPVPMKLTKEATAPFYAGARPGTAYHESHWTSLQEVHLPALPAKHPFRHQPHLPRPIQPTMQADYLHSRLPVSAPLTQVHELCVQI